MGPGILPETTLGKHNLLCHLQMPTKAISRKKEAICEHGPESAVLYIYILCHPDMKTKIFVSFL